MEITNDTLKELLSKAFDFGNSGIYELKDQYIEEVLLSAGGEKIETGLAVMPVAKLRTLQVGQKINHSQFGEATVAEKGSEKYAQFSGFRFFFDEDDWPWTEPLQVMQ